MKKKRFLFVSFQGSGIDIAWQTVREGHDVKFYIANKNDRDVGDGFVPKVKNWRAAVKWAEVVVFDDVFAFGDAADKIRRSGKLVIGGTAYTNRLEIDRSFGQSELQRRGIAILGYREFTSFDLAIKYVRAHRSAYVIKPSGLAQNSKQLLFVGQEADGNDVIRTLAAYKKHWAGKIKSFQLQKKVSGVEIGIGAFFNGRRFIAPVNINFEHKRLFPGDVGPLTDEMGTSMFWAAPNRLFAATLQKFEAKLAAEKYVGYIDLNCIVNQSGIYPLEFTARFGCPTIHIQQAGMLMPTGEFLYQLASGADFTFPTRAGFQVGVVLAVAPFPYYDQRLFDAYSKNTAIVFKNPAALAGVHMQDIRLKAGQWLVAGFGGFTAVVVGTGATMPAAQTQAYARIKNIHIPNMYYRHDIGDRWGEDAKKLRQWGYLRAA